MSVSVQETFGAFGPTTLVASYFDYLSTMIEIKQKPDSADAETKVEIEKRLMEIESAWLLNPNLLSNPKKEGEHLGEVLVRWSCNLLDGKEFLLGEYFQKLFKFGSLSHLKRQLPQQLKGAWQPFCDAIMNTIDIQARRDTAYRRGGLRVVFPRPR